METWFALIRNTSRNFETGSRKPESKFPQGNAGIGWPGLDTRTTLGEEAKVPRRGEYEKA